MCVITFGGDFVVTNRVLKHFNEDSFFSNFDSVRDVFRNSDLSVINLEAPLLDIEDGAFPIYKCGPNLRSPKSSVKLLQYLGVNMALLANNHIYDYGDKGIDSTLNVLDKAGIDCVGAGKNLEHAKKVKVICVGKFKIAFINCCEIEYSIATSEHGGANPLDIVSITRDIQTYKNKCDKVILNYHGGIEHYSYPSPRLKQLLRFFIEQGADVVITHHQHCISGYEYYQQGVIFYGLGNFCFDMNKSGDASWTNSLIVQINMEDINDIKIVPILQNAVKVGVICNENEEIFRKLKDINSIIRDDVLLKEKFNSFLHSTKNEYNSALFPLSGRVMDYLNNRNLLPRFFTRDKILYLRDMFTCDSHRERFISYIDAILKL